MQNFLKLCEVARANGVLGNIFSQGKYQRVTMKFDEKISQWLEKTQPIVFVTDEQVIDNEIPNENKWGYAKGKMDAPFKFFSIEKLNGPLLHSPDCKISQAFNVLCVAVNEVAPNEYRFLTLTELCENGHLTVAATNSEVEVVNNFLKFFNRQEVGILPSRAIIKLGNGELKRTHRIRRVVYVSPKREMQKLSESHKTIDWTHRWLVRGHWRQIGDKLGKDREGNYCVKGFTWVTEFEKGPETAPLITKTRIVGSLNN